ncbi:MAG: hypothetical protein Unbinned3138contig1000_4 [Prokaryotic dsDNA virus sp.]|nr:MAG: hypothetical protein Unbinned3138contig1000_4 [Prokaryotic dsDNA virus sp.]|tara:strand:- start:686 stop:1210 length:525 start_codon:yes stop_codon:yes gene_type:complete
MTHRADEILTQAAAELADRAKTYDAPEGERSMGKTVAAFNAITGHSLTEQQGWQFMEILKIVRSNQGAFRADSFTDAAAYAALAGECAGRGLTSDDEPELTANEVWCLELLAPLGTRNFDAIFPTKIVSDIYSLHDKGFVVLSTPDPDNYRQTITITEAGRAALRRHKQKTPRD